MVSGYGELLNGTVGSLAGAEGISLMLPAYGTMPSSWCCARRHRGRSNSNEVDQRQPQVLQGPEYRRGNERKY